MKLSAPASIFLILLFCSPQAQDKATALFVIGQVTVTKPGSPPRPLKHLETIEAGDSIATGPSSTAVIDVASMARIQILSNTKVTMDAILKRDTTSMKIETGTLITGVQKLKKGSLWEVRTPTSLAAVRGTRFSVTSAAGRSVVAVDEGSVAVKTIDAKEERIIAQGTSAEVTREVVTRPMNETERRELEQFKAIPDVPNPSNIDIEELKKIERSHFEEREYMPDVKGEKASGEKKNGADSDSKKAAEAAVVWTAKRAYQSGETITVFYKNLPENRYCWISIDKASAPPGRQEAYNWTYSASNGRMDFSGLNLEPGSYEARVHFTRSNTVDIRIPFTVK